RTRIRRPAKTGEQDLGVDEPDPLGKPKRCLHRRVKSVTAWLGGQRFELRRAKPGIGVGAELSAGKRVAPEPARHRPRQRIIGRRRVEDRNAQFRWAPAWHFENRSACSYSGRQLMTPR